MAHPETEASTIAQGIVEDDPIKRIQATLDGPDDDEAPLDEAPDDNQIPEEADADPENTEQTEEPATPAIDPPVSWTAEDKELFAQLPPEAQAVIARRESERDKAVQSKATEAAEARKSREQAEAAIHQLHSAYTSQLEQFLATNEPQKPDPAWLNTAAYGEEGPRTFYQMQAAYEAHQAQRTQAQQELQTAQQRQAALTERQQQAFYAEQHQLLSDPEKGIPGWSDPSRQPEIAKQITEFANAHGYAEQLTNADAQDVRFLHVAMGWKDKGREIRRPAKVEDGGCSPGQGTAQDGPTQCHAASRLSAGAGQSASSRALQADRRPTGRRRAHRQPPLTRHGFPRRETPPLPLMDFST
jgi:hypothetical protein